MDLPKFRYHSDPVASGSVVPSADACVCCGQARGFLYVGPVYSEEDVEGKLCPWCVADGSAAEKYDASFVDAEALADNLPPATVDEITRRTPGYQTWQHEDWPPCCGDAPAFIAPVGTAGIRAQYRELEGVLLDHIVYDLKISGGAATRLAESLDRDAGPTAYLFQCAKCNASHFRIDRP